ncbi:type II toxin-antitoxin system VapC family toxin [Candidatus Micrarchaeota archaeon]|nr:type II toxin-antitoxin system VapC family toxin [Candidatus Micrarchaeota archaeon]
MEKICLDFEATLDFLRGDPGIIEKLKYYADREEICITSFTFMHLLESVKKPEVISAFVNSITVLGFDAKAARVASDICEELSNSGDVHKRMESIMTAAICISNNAFLFSRTPSKFDGIKVLRKV